MNLLELAQITLLYFIGLTFVRKYDFLNAKEFRRKKMFGTITEAVLTYFIICENHKNKCYGFNKRLGNGIKHI